MKRFLVTLVLAISAGTAVGWASPATDPTSFAVNLHVSKSSLEIVPGEKQNTLGQRLGATIDGRHLVLEGNAIVGKTKLFSPGMWLLPVGDYKAKVKSDDTAPNGVRLRQYEILLKDGSSWGCYVFAESE